MLTFSMSSLRLLTTSSLFFGQISLLFCPALTQAQIVPDIDINGSNRSNLFHSFESFDVVEDSKGNNFFDSDNITTGGSVAG